MIESFSDQGTADIWAGHATKAALKRLPRQLWAAAQALMDHHRATKVSDMVVPPGNKLKLLKHDKRGIWAVRIDRNWRLEFTFENGRANAVEITNHYGDN